MVLTGRAPLVALAGVLVVLVVPAPGAAVLLLVGLLAAGTLVDVALAGSVRRLRLARSGATQTRLGEPVTVTLVVANTGRRRVRGWLRDAWVPSAGATPRQHRVDVPPGERRRHETRLLPTRRGDQNTVHVTVRSLGSLGLAGRQRRHTRVVDGQRMETAP